MDRMLGAAMLVGIGVSQLAFACAHAAQAPSLPSTPGSEIPLLDSTSLSPAPKTKSTILGGEIRSVDPVRDQFILKVFGQRSVKIIFDEHTVAYLDGDKIPLHSLASYEHASVQTVLVGTDVYSLTIHMLSQSPEGECQGRVLDYSPTEHELRVTTVLSSKPMTLLVPVSTPVIPMRQTTSSSAPSEPADLIKGSLVFIRFKSNKEGKGVASEIKILAIPGVSSVFAGTLSSVDKHTGTLVLADPKDDESYEIFCDSIMLKSSKDLHIGESITVTATFDGKRYVASTIGAD